VFPDTLANPLEVFVQPVITKVDTRVRVRCGFGLGKQGLQYFKLVDDARQCFPFGIRVGEDEWAL